MFIYKRLFFSFFLWRNHLNSLIICFHLSKIKKNTLATYYEYLQWISVHFKAKPVETIGFGSNCGHNGVKSKKKKTYSVGIVFDCNGYVNWLIYFCSTYSVTLSLVWQTTNDPDDGLGFELVSHASNLQASSVKGVHVEKSALGINLRFIGVSKVIGRIATVVELDGRPLFSFPSPFVSCYIRMYLFVYACMRVCVVCVCLCYVEKLAISFCVFSDMYLYGK